MHLRYMFQPLIIINGIYSRSPFRFRQDQPSSHYSPSFALRQNIIYALLRICLLIPMFISNVCPIPEQNQRGHNQNDLTTSDIQSRPAAMPSAIMSLINNVFPYYQSQHFAQWMELIKR